MKGRLLTVLLAVVPFAGALCEEPEPAVCPNTIAEDGENQVSCCRDVGCDFGFCAGEPNTPGECREAWEQQCIDALATDADGPPSCIGPLVCGASAASVPSYDCTACPCPGSDACYEGVCTDADTRNRERFDDVVADDLLPEEYGAFFRMLATLDSIPVAEAALLASADIARDSRTTIVVAGADPAMNTTDLDTVVRALLVETPFAFTQRLDLRDRAADVCAEVQSSSSTGLLPVTFVAAFVPDDGASRATCEFPGTFARCDVPVAADCAATAGRIAYPVVIVDQIVALKELDHALLLRAGLAPPDVRDSFLTQSLGVFASAVDIFPLQEGFRVANRFGAAFVDGERKVTWILLADPNARPDHLTGYRLVWNDPPSQQYLIAHDIQARDCAFDVLDDGLLLITCDNAGFRLTATVDPGLPALLDVEQDP
jgi:hypothetical protein